MSPFLILLAAILAAVMGFAIQRGATCTVAAVDEWMVHRRARRLASMVEASLWVAGGLLIADALRAPVEHPAGVPLSAFTVAGAVLLGLGAFVNRACVFGAVARIGSGEWVYLLTPVGFFAGCLLASDRHVEATVASPLWGATPLLAVPAAAFMLLRVGVPAHASWRAGTRPAWTPHAATAVIAITFFFLLVSMGAWAYTDVLAELARGMQKDVATRVLLVVALLAGAVAGGWAKCAVHRPTWRDVLRCLAGGMMMGAGSLLIPGSNDGLVLLGMPLLWPSAWVAFAVMCVTIALAMRVAGAAR